ncbi:60S acidic ribosomal protein P0-1 [Dendrobium catenatum]|uniref:60S acidic ribosomal protein P0-1 n=1 Tax=Dendrobium catenatum TaxID=906689 RepID=A0A2I0WEA4_9ASPA|nr:60S acidic ribosomal protein P0-1 [Dendrobium catenatum]
MGKNTLMRWCIKVHAEKSGNQAYLSCLPLLMENVGLIFTKEDLNEVSEEVAKYKVGAPARVGLVAPIDVVVPQGNTSLDPSQTSFFQVLNIPTKINKGTIKIITPIELIKKGDKVGSSEAALLAKLRIRPFSYGLVVQYVYEDGSVFSPQVLDFIEDDLIEKFLVGLSMAEKVKEYLKDRNKFVVFVASATPATSAAPAATVEEQKKEPAEESDEDMGFSLFD